MWSQSKNRQPALKEQGFFLVLHLIGWDSGLIINNYFSRPITEWSKAKPKNSRITFDNQMKTALLESKKLHIPDKETWVNPCFRLQSLRSSVLIAVCTSGAMILYLPKDMTKSMAFHIYNYSHINTSMSPFFFSILNRVISRIANLQSMFSNCMMMGQQQKSWKKT